MNKDELLSLFPEPVFISAYPYNYEKELEFIKSFICEKENKTGEIHHNRQSIDTFVLNRPELSKIKEFIQNKIQEYSKKIIKSRKDLVITQSWINKSVRDEYHQEHTHPNSIASGVFYFVSKDDMPPVLFRRKNHREISLSVDEYNDFNSSRRTIYLKSGDLIIFPSNMIHGVPPNNTDNERISLAFNTWVKGNLGDIDALTYLSEDMLSE